MKTFATFALTVSITLATGAADACADKVFGTVWREKYVPGEPSTDAEESWVSAAKKARCYVCHLKGKSKKYCNTYGDALSEWLKSDNYETERVKAEEEKVRAEILQALGQAEALGDKCGTTFGELFRAYKLPNADMGPKSAQKHEAGDEGEDEQEDQDEEDDD
jgi:hypothetical protein